MRTLSQITSLPQLIKNLVYGGGYDGYQGILDSIEFDRKEVKPYCHWSKKHYVRISLARMDVFELYLICWEKGQETPIYQLNHVNAWVYVLEGELTDEEYRLPSNNEAPIPYQKNILQKRKYTETSDNVGLHKLINSHKGRTISLHLFMDEVNKWQVFNPKTKELEEHDFKTHFTYDL